MILSLPTSSLRNSDRLVARHDGGVGIEKFFRVLSFVAISRGAINPWSGKVAT